jgi:zinc protease
LIPTVHRYRLQNGLLVLLKEINTAPIISHWVWYRVGSRDEIPGKTGLSHWVEHMQFKGTTAYPPGVLDKAISRVGGMWNAMTSNDWTAYFETLPAGEIDLALNLESDRFRNSLFSPDDVESERTVILSELQGSENSPFYLLAEAVQKAAFPSGGYHHEVIGEREDLLSIQRDHLYDHYRANYTPPQAVLTVAGAFDVKEMRAKIEQHYGPIKGGPGEPAATGKIWNELGAEATLTLDGPGETTFFQAAYRFPSAADPDIFPLLVATSLLTGPSNLNAFGSGISNKTSRLYRTLVESENAVSVFGGMQATIDPFLYTIGVIIHPLSSVTAAVGLMDAEILRLQEELAPEPSLARAVKQARALFAYGSESITNQAFWLGFSEMFASYDWFETYLARLESVSPEDVRRVAAKYLRPTNRVLGDYKPHG